MFGAIPFQQSPEGLVVVKALSPVAWYRYGVGLTDAGGGLCSAWADQSGNGNNLVQATGGNQPAIQADNSILFDGVDNFMQAAFTLNQPCAYYFLGKQITWTSGDRILDGVAGTVIINQSGSGTSLAISAGVGLPFSVDPGLDTYFVACAVFNGASSVAQLNTSSATGDAGAANPGGVTVGSARTGGAQWSNIQVKEVIIFAAAHDATTRARVIRYLAAVGGIAV